MLNFCVSKHQLATIQLLVLDFKGNGDHLSIPILGDAACCLKNPCQEMDYYIAASVPMLPTVAALMMAGNI
jgi:hypothetical protein